MRLTDLEPEWLKWESPSSFKTVATLEEANGLWFLCPDCFKKNGGKVGTHAIICWSRSRGAPEDARPGPGRWKIDGTSFEDVTFNADPPEDRRSIRLTSGCNAHFHITGGEVHP